MTTQTNKGFTIVELLIVIVVIAILAAISIVAYTGIQNRARASSGQQLASQIAKKFEAAGAVKGTYYSTNGAGVTGALLNTYANAAPVAPEAVVDTPANVLAATSNAGAGFDATAASNGTRVATWACTGGALVFWWDYSVTTGQLKSIRAGAGC